MADFKKHYVFKGKILIVGFGAVGQGTLPLILRPDTELLEYICNENNKYFDIVPKAGTK